MITYNSIVELAQAQLLVGDIVQVLGENKAGDRATMVGVVRVQGHQTPNRVGAAPLHQLSRGQTIRSVYVLFK